MKRYTRKETLGISWDSEAWDTSLSIIALTLENNWLDIVQNARIWLHDIRDTTIIRHKKSGVWYDEVWETTLSTIALIRSVAIREGPVQQLSWIEEVIEWLIAIPSKMSGEFVCPHYSGFLVWLLGEIKQSPETKAILNSKFYNDFNTKVLEAKNWLLSISEDNSDDLWSLYTFSNSYIIIGLSSLKEKLPQSLLNKIVKWYFKKSPRNPGVFEDIEDTSLAIIALSSIMNDFNIDKQKLFTKISLKKDYS